MDSETLLKQARADNPDGLSCLNVGCGRNPRKGWVNLDSPHHDSDDVVKVDFEDAHLPFEDDTFDVLEMTHVIEHVYNVLPFMEELHRVAKPGAVLLVACPYGSSDDAFEDPTHVRPMFPGSFRYFSQPTFWKADYGYRGDWKVIAMALFVDKSFFPAWESQAGQIEKGVIRERNVVHDMRVQLSAVKPIRSWREPLDVWETNVQPIEINDEAMDAKRTDLKSL